MVRLVFGQTQVNGRDLRSLLDIHVPANGIRQFLRSIDDVDESLRQLMAQGYSASEMQAIETEPEHSVGLSANVIATAFAAGEACLDFYALSTFSVAHAILGKGSLSADPVVRITCPTEILLGLIERLRDVSKTLPSHTLQEDEHA